MNPTPKEKARQLANRVGKHHAVFMCDEMIRELWPYSNDYSKNVGYWQKVKSELLKL